VPQINPLPGARLTSDFGVRDADPVTGKVLVDGHHDGYDLAAPMGSPIRAAKAGKVKFVGARGGYGNAVILEHPEGWETLYGHASRLAVKLGQAIKAGEVIAYVGSTGHSTGPHLHYELRRHGRAVDPKLAVTAAIRPTPAPAEAARGAKPKTEARKAKVASRAKPKAKKPSSNRTKGTSDRIFRKTGR
jgi:murein DD-endopeptidase MepM/ murein hydrolase activator NlpD